MGKRGMRNRKGNRRGPRQAMAMKKRSLEYSPVSFWEPAASRKWPVEPMNSKRKITLPGRQIRVNENQMNQIDVQKQTRKDNSDNSNMIAVLDKEKCLGCMACSYICPTGAISKNEQVAKIDQSKCTGCGLCISQCPQGALYLKETLKIG